MAIDGYMYFFNYNNEYEKSESQVAKNVDNQRDLFWRDANFNFKAANDAGGLFEVEDCSFDVEQTLNIGSQSTGVGAGKIVFNPFSITRKIDLLSPKLFEMSCSGTPFKKVALGLRKSAGGDTTGCVFVAFIFKMVGVKTISWSYDDEAPKETTTFEYGGFQIHYRPQKPDGTFGECKPGGWNRVRNVRDQMPNEDIKFDIK
jgi:type VI protein secretion system component Hcp